MARRFAILCALLWLYSLAVFDSRCVQRTHTSPGTRHVFPLPDRPAFLTEELALEKAREALRFDGYDPAEWQPRGQAHRTKAPDGRPDQFLFRDERDANQGLFEFNREARVRVVGVELDGDRVICHSR